MGSEEAYSSFLICIDLNLQEMNEKFDEQIKKLPYFANRMLYYIL
jgi:hypothetical protein